MAPPQGFKPLLDQGVAHREASPQWPCSLILKMTCFIKNLSDT